MTIVLTGSSGVVTPSIETNDIAYRNSSLSDFLRERDRIINGSFDFWQRGTSFSGLSYGADRWFNYFVGGAATMSRQSFAVGDTIGSSSQKFFMRHSVSGQTLASHQARFQQRVEDVRSYTGQMITVLGWARRVSGSGNMSVSVGQYFGTGGSPSSDVLTPGQIVSLSSFWAPFAVSIEIPSIVGKTIGTNENSLITINFWTSAGSDFNFESGGLGLQTIEVDFANIHILSGVHQVEATNFYAKPDLTSEYNKCLRYFCQALVSENHIVPTPAASYAGTMRISFPVRMRTTPSISISYSVLTNVSTVQNLAIGPDAFTHYMVGSVSTNIQGVFTWNADAEL